MNYKRRKRNIFFIIILFLICLILGSYLRSKYSLQLSEYRISSPKIQEKVRIVQLSDLHNSRFGRDNARLLALIQEQSPDVILITGDLLNSSTQDTTAAVELIKSLDEIAPVYVSYGNHEIEYEQNFGTEIGKLYEEAGAVVLDRSYQDLEINGQQIRIGGIYGYCLPEKYLSSGEANPEECEFLSEFQNTTAYTVLMCHMPVCWLLNDGLDEWKIDCVLSGHVHGGQIILPFGGGMYGPDFGWFPGRLSGVFHSSDEDKTLIISRGLGSTEKIPRLNNVPEVVVVDLVPEGEESNE